MITLPLPRERRGGDGRSGLLVRWLAAATACGLLWSCSETPEPERAAGSDDEVTDTGLGLDTPAPDVSESGETEETAGIDVNDVDDAPGLDTPEPDVSDVSDTTDYLDVTEPEDVAGTDASDVVDTGPKVSPFADVGPSPTACEIPPSAPPACETGVELVYKGPAFPLGKGYWGGVYLDGYLHAGGGTSSLNVWDISEPKSPILAGTGSAPVYHPLTDGTYVYTGGGWWSGLRVYDVSVPTEPAVVGVGPAVGQLFHAGAGRVYALASNIAAYDVSDPTKPTKLGSWMDVDTSLITAGVASDIVVFRSVPVSGVIGGYYFGVVDFREPDPLLVSGAPLIYGYAGPAGGTMPSSVGKNGVWATVHHQGPMFWLVEVSTPSGNGSVVLKGSSALDAKRLGERVYVLGIVDEATHLMVYDISEPKSPKKLSSVPVVEPLTSFALGDGLLFGLGPDANVSTWTTADEGPELLGAAKSWTIKPPSTVSGMMVVEDVLYIANGGGLWTASLCEPKAPPVLLDHAKVKATVQCMDVEGDKAYLAGQDLIVIDVSDPSDTKVVSTVPVDGAKGSWLIDIDVKGGWAFAITNSDLDHGQVYDVSDPLAPTFVTNIEAPPEVAAAFFGATAVAVADDWTVVVAYLGTIATYDVTNPAEPVLSGQLKLPVVVQDLDVHADLLGTCTLDGAFLVDLSELPDLSILAEVPLSGVNKNCDEGVFEEGVWVINGGGLVGKGPELAVVDISSPIVPFVSTSLSVGEAAVLAVSEYAIFSRNADQIDMYSLPCK